MTANATDLTGGATFTVRLPPEWLILDAFPGGQRMSEQVEQLLDEALTRDQRTAEHRGFVKRQVREALRQARSQHLDFCALLATVIDDVLPMLATFTIAKRSIGDGSEGIALLEQLQRRPGTEVGVLSVTGVGDVVRARFSQQLTEAQRRGGRPARAGSGPMEAAIWQYFIPTPRHRDLVVATAATPVTQLAGSFGELFDAVVQTFRFTDESQAVT